MLKSLHCSRWPAKFTRHETRNRRGKIYHPRAVGLKPHCRSLNRSELLGGHHILAAISSCGAPAQPGRSPQAHRQRPISVAAHV